jgi:hypothetical protein
LLFSERDFSKPFIIKKTRQKTEQWIIYTHIFENTLLSPFFCSGFPIWEKNKNFVNDHPMNIPIKIGFNLPSGFREDDLNVKGYRWRPGRQWQIMITDAKKWVRWAKKIILNYGQGAEIFYLKRLLFLID